jgi:hypothetical protein
VKQLSGAPLKGMLLASPTNIRLGWKGLPGTNTLAYYENPLIMTVKSFIVQAPRVVNKAPNIFIVQATGKCHTCGQGIKGEVSLYH